MMNSFSTMSTFLVMMLFAIAHIQMTMAEDCGSNEIPATCAPALTCQPSCTHPEGQLCPRLCSMNTCVCNTSFLRDDNDNFRCVQPSQCTAARTIRASKCGENEVESECALLQNCQPSCENPNGTACPRICSRNPCQCKAGYVRRSKDDLTCVSMFECYAGHLRAFPCGENEQYTSCVEPCQPSCEEPNRSPCPATDCSEGCVCSAAYARDSNDITSSCIKCPIVLD